MKKIIIILLLFVMCVSYVGCNNKGSEIDTLKDNPNHTNIIDKEKSLKPLANNGITEYKIVIAENASESITYAAKELSAFTLESTDTYLPIVSDNNAVYNESNAIISIGKTKLLEKANLNIPYATLNIDGFVIQSIGNMIFIDGNLERGTLYGVYDFLEKILGVRFLTQDVTHVPKHTNVPLYEMYIKEIPDFPLRLYLSAETYHTFGSQAFVARSRQDSSYLATTHSKYGEETSIFSRGEKDHNMHYYVDQKIYNDPLKTDTYHPEFYKHDPILGTTICLTNGITDDGKLDENIDISVANIVIEEMKKDIEANPQKTYFIFEHEDGWFYCECDKCKEVSHSYKRSGLLIRFMNVLNKAIQDWLDTTDANRIVKFVTYAYSYTIDPPVEIDGNKVTPIDETVIAQKEIVFMTAFGYSASYAYNSEKQSDLIYNSINNWKVVGSTFFYWVHDKDFNDYVSYQPYLKHVKTNILAMKDYGVEFVMIQGPQNAKNDWQAQLRSYMYTKLMWNSDLDSDALMEEFILLYFGKEAAPFVFDFIYSYENNYELALKKNPDLKIYTSEYEYVNPLKGYITLEFIENMVDILNSAEEAIKANNEYTFLTKDEYLRRIAQLKLTPLGTLLRSYNLFKPSEREEDKMQFMKKYFEIVDYSRASHYTELTTFDMWKKTLGV